MSGPTGHSKLGASSAHRWSICTASVKAQEGLPEQTSEYAAEGTALHAVAAKCLENGVTVKAFLGVPFDYEDHGEPRCIILDEEQADAVQLYLDTIRADHIKRGGALQIEKRFHLPHLHPDFFGTCDCARIGRDNVLTVYDAKFGRGHVVEVQTPETMQPNKQLAYYALGALYGTMNWGAIEGIELVVIQPRAYHPKGPVRRAVFSVATIEAMGNLLALKAGEATSSAATYVPGDHCTFCRAAATCHALRARALATAQLDFDDQTNAVVTSRLVPPERMSPERIADVMEAADLMEDWVFAVREHAKLLAAEGHELVSTNGVRFTLAEKKGHRKWKYDDTTTERFLRDLGLDGETISRVELKSPAQVEKLMPKSERPALAELYERKSSGTALVRENSQPRLQVLPPPKTERSK